MSSETAFSQNNNDSLAKENMIMKIRKPKKYPSFYLSSSYLSWQGMPSNVEYNPNNNRELSVYKMFNLFRYSNHFNAALGVSASMMTMHNNVNKWQFDSSGLVSSSQIIPDTFDKRKLTAYYLYMPVEVKYRFGSKSRRPPFNIGLGGRIGALLYAGQKTKVGDIKIKEQVKDGLSKINYGAYAYFGYKFVGIMAGYNFSPMFDSDHSPDVTNWTVGVTFLF
jgi:hypothetical protein